MSIEDKDVLVITSCSAKKKETSIKIKAKDLYQGDFFKKVKKFALNNNFTLKIISAKYGLLSEDDKVLPYNKKIKSGEDINALRIIVVPELKKIINNYDKILLLMGEDYKKIIKPIIDDKFVFFFDERGLGGYKSLMTHLLKMNKKNLFKLIFEQKRKRITIELINNVNFKFKTLIDTNSD